MVMICQLIMGKSNGTLEKEMFIGVFSISSMGQNGLQVAAEIKLLKSRTKQWQCTTNEKKPNLC